jgi:4-hydroxy-tetrahydrodipicolinate synthase
MDAALHINPYYGKTSREGLIYHFSAVLDYGPTIVYNVPGRTGQDIAPDVVHELALHPNFAGMKECTGNDRIKGYTARGITCWSGACLRHRPRAPRDGDAGAPAACPVVHAAGA